ncbi:MAG: DUF3179 domain-containing protein [Rhodospirillales bacterium]
MQIVILALAALIFPAAGAQAACEGPACGFEDEGWDTDFSKTTVDLNEILSGGPPKDGIPSIDDPKFVPVAEAEDLSDTDPVIGVIVGGEARAYPLRVLTWHEIVNDEIGGVPVAVTYCPLCNAAIVFDRRVKGRVLEFGTTGKLRRSDLVMYDRETESWWQQFSGESIAGEYAGAVLKVLPARLESWANFKSRAGEGRVLVPNKPGKRAYGRNPYMGYDAINGTPFLYRGPYDLPVPMMMRVVAAEGRAWTLPYVRRRGVVKDGGLTLSWTAGQNSALDSLSIAKGRDVGNIIVRRGGADIPYDVTFAFVFNAFHPEGPLAHDPEDAR